MTNHGEYAKQLFMEGYNCSQAVLLAFSDVTGLDRDTAALLSSSFGGGLGRMREVCGAVSGAAMVLGIKSGCADPKNFEAKKENYSLVQEFASRYRAENGSIICRELLSGSFASQGGAPEARTAEYYKKRPCPELVKNAAEILDGILEERKL